MPVPGTIRTAIEARLERLSGPCRQTLTQAAVLGRQFRLDVLAAQTATPEDDLVDLLEEAVRARLLREVRAAGEDHFEFVQSMAREVIYDGVLRHRRRRLHHRTAEALEQVLGTRQSEHAGEIADHLLEAGEEVRAVHLLIAAGEQAASLLAHDDAIRRLEAARTLLEDSGQHEEALGVLERLGELYQHSGQPDKAVETYKVALARSSSTANSRRTATLRWKLGQVYSYSFDFAAAIPELELALKNFEGEATADALMLYHDLAHAYTFSNEPARGIPWAQKALEFATASGLTDIAANAHVMIGLALAWLGQLGEAAHHHREAVRLAEGTTSFLGKNACRRSLNNLGALEDNRGNHRAAIELYKKALVMAEELRNPTWILFQLINLAESQWMLGDWGASRESAGRVLAVGERAGLGRVPASSRDIGILLAYLAEDWEAAADGLRATLADAEHRHNTQGIQHDLWDLAEVNLWLQRYDQAEQFARRALEWRPLMGPLILLADSLAQQQRLEEAIAVCDRAEERMHHVKMEDSNWPGKLHHVRGLIAAAAGKLDEAILHLEAAIRTYDEFPEPYWQARVFEDLGRLYAESNRDRALTAYESALSIYQRLGARHSVTRVQERLAALGA